jgi:dTDP-4-amino-4,6-dideoxygalactose transaminase
MIRLTIPSIEQDDLDAVRDVVASGYLVQATHVEAFERAVADYVGATHAVAVSNCTAALHLALLTLKIGPGDRVAVPTYSWPATANVVALCGAEPVFVDINAETFNMDPGALADALQQTTVKAILPVHTFGGMADMTAIRAIAARSGAPVIEDAACALGSDLSGLQAGLWGVMGCFSFHPRKAVTTGEGGVVTTNDAAYARQLRILRNHGLDPAASVPDFVAPGYNLRMTEFQAALGVTQMSKLERIIASRRAGAARYDELLRHTGMTAPRALAGSRHVYQSYVALLPKASAPRRAEIISALKSEGIETAIGTYHIPLTTYFRTSAGFRRGDFPVTDDIASRAITLPLHERLTTDDQMLIISALKRMVGEGD